MGLTLVFDTSGPWVAAGLAEGALLRAGAVEAMAKGQAERLMPLLSAVMDEAGAGWADIGQIGVGVGPGNFTGIRISVAAARGLALGLGVPALGITSFELMRCAGGAREALVLLEAPRGALYAQRFSDGTAGEPLVLDPEVLPEGLAGPGLTVIGHRAAEIAGRLGADAEERVLEDLPARLAAVAAGRMQAGIAARRPAPLYVRPADAAPSRVLPPVLLA